MNLPQKNNRYLMCSKINRTLLLLNFLVFFSFTSFSQQRDVSSYKIFTATSDKAILLESAAVLQNEIYKRTDIQLPIAVKQPKKLDKYLILGLEKDISLLNDDLKKRLQKLPSLKAEGYKIIVADQSIIIAGHDARGILYGVGKFLRNARLQKNKILFDANYQIATSPKYPIRGHQLGYRPKTNSYDAFTVAQFDQYILDLALFGANIIEIMPPRTDDDPVSSHMKLDPAKMVVEQARICKKYGLDVSMWYPNMGKDYESKEAIEKELAERAEVFKLLPKLNTVFVPAGDPGDLQPDVLFNWLQKEAEVLKKYHPEAKIWVSPQAFRPTDEWFNQFFGHVNANYPWFGGVVFGPWVRMPIDKIRARVDPKIPIRRYPDITHNYSSQYPVPNWDLVWAITADRESINPRPLDEKTIHNALDQYAIGSVSYSEGTNDDVNKFVWSDQDWDPETPVIETLRDYARLFVGTEYSDKMAQALLALERNWRGEVITNNGINITLKQWQDLEKNASLNVLQNPRFQMGLIRAYFDAYIRLRLIRETELERQATETLQNATKIGSENAISQVQKTLETAWKEPIQQDYHQKCLDLADSLYKSIGAQLTIKKHGGVSGRGNFIDLINLPLNDAPWILDQIKKISKITTESDRLVAIEKILNRTNPGEGGFYDHMGDPESNYRIQNDIAWQTDPGGLRSPRVSFSVGLLGEKWVDEIQAIGSKGQITPKVWVKQATTLYGEPLKIKYDNLDPTAKYRIRLSYTGRFRSTMKLQTDDHLTVHELIETGTTPTFEFDVPKAATSDGEVTFIWTCAEGGRGSQVTEIWLIPVPNTK